MEQQKPFESSYERQVGNIQFEFEPSYVRISFDNQEGFHQLYLEKNKSSIQALKRLVQSIFNVESWELQPDDYVLPNANPFEQAFQHKLDKTQGEHVAMLGELLKILTAYFKLEILGSFFEVDLQGNDIESTDGQALADRTAKIEF